MRRLILDRSEDVMKFVASLTGEARYPNYDDAIGLEKDGRLVAGVVYQAYNGPNVAMHFAVAGSPHVITPGFVCAAFRFPFILLRCNRISGYVRADNLAAQQLDENLGFRREGVIREGASDRTDFILYGMLKHECRFLEGRYLRAMNRDLAQPEIVTP
ncbi:GNAT family N-acetyltransferase [Burkholderia anthina]|uniref:GNAT family N-acetyltransferase n=1 Tax=Burkholderia anthina TaxID=179879 RepID=UPI001CF1A2DC|nr:GNAT family protein [Burkholderia anthina]MCA8095231.1 GNAT family N-acetyltransferase [Burkholderia anthina]